MVFHVSSLSYSARNLHRPKRNPQSIEEKWATVKREDGLWVEPPAALDL